MKTPCYVIHKGELDNNFDLLKCALEKYWNNYIIGYSYKTNALPWVIKEFDRKGCYAEVVSEDEYELAKLVGVKKENIVYNGPIKTKTSFIEALSNGNFVNIDSAREIEWLEELPRNEYNLGIRINFDIETMCPNQSQCGSEGGRFGFCYENGELQKAIKRIQQKGFDIRGIHLHVSSKTRSVEIYKAIAQIACEIKERFALNLSFVDIGGGFFGGLVNKPQFNDYLEAITQILSKSFDRNKTTLIIEPGMSLIGAPISYVTTVLDVKDTIHNRFVITDGTRTSIDPLMSKKGYFHRYKKVEHGEIKEKQVICGYTCLEHDRLYTAVDEEELFIGDKIIYDKVGAYTMCLTPLFIKYFPDVYVEENNKFTLIRKAWTPTEYIQNSIIEDM